MTGVLNFVTLPQDAEKRLQSDAGITLAKIRLLQKALHMQEAKISLTLTENDLKEVEASIRAIPLTKDVFEPIVLETPNVPEFLSVRDVSKLIGRVPQVVRRHCASGKYNAEQVAGENGTWRIKPEQFMHLSNWEAFLKEREREIQSSKSIANHGLQFWQDEDQTDNGSI